MRNDRTYVQHMLEAIQTIESYIAGCTFDAFVGNKMMVDAVVRELEILGEAANQVSEDMKDKHPKIPWFKMRGLRNFVIHEYFAVNEKIVWDTCKENLPGLKVQLEQLIG
ncbi:MAG: DUF86 domain-containing protein [Phycisphaerae bacterium]|nr:DUF86 domain-containing protein [Phycisphaerae bacterium]